MRKIKVATRKSKLALIQTDIVVQKLRRLYPEIDFEIVGVTTRGDKRPYQQEDLKAAFTSELEEMLVHGEADIAVHSLKDIPTEINQDIIIAATPVRSDPRDVLISHSGKKLEELPPNPKIGTSSKRRAIQILKLRRDAEIFEIHGNVDTRVRKFRSMGLDGIVLAAAGLERLGLLNLVSQYFNVEDMVPAPCQGTIAVQVRRDRTELIKLLQTINDERIMKASECERAFVSRIGGDCNFPVGIYTEVDGNKTKASLFVSFKGRIISENAFTQDTEPRDFGFELAEKVLRGFENG